MRMVITGGAGYIGSHVAWALAERGVTVTIVDDLSAGRADRVSGLPLHRADLADPAQVAGLSRVLAGADGVIHFAARKSVGESVERPAWYHQQNVGSLANLLLAVEQADVGTVLFSSSAAVYGASEGYAITEDEPLRPINPYGATKVAGEQLLAETTATLGLHTASLRYFNAAGVGRPELADTAVTNLVPIVVGQLLAGQRPEIYGDDYPTPDGTCIRDYVHVLDLVDAHLATLDHLGVTPPGHEVFNVGTGTGSSVAEVIRAVAAAAGEQVDPIVVARRPGDPAVAVADPSRIRAVMGWTSQRTLTDIVGGVWQAAAAARGRA